MKIDWGHVRQAVERGLHSAEAGERGGMRVHCGSAERMLHGTKDDTGKQVLELVHKAKSSLETSRGVDMLKQALALCPTA